MDLRDPGFLIREARPDDHATLLELARELDSINLPTDAAGLTAVLKHSASSFRGRMRNRSRAVYVFCAEELATGKVVAASMIIGKHGTPTAPHYYLQMDSDQRFSRTLRKTFRHAYLRLRYSMDGPTEIGGLIVAPALRHHPARVGKQISWVRFLYLGKHQGRFERRVEAEMLAPMLPGHGNLFWDHYGRTITELSFREADLLSARDKEFIHALFPDSPLYTFLLPDDVRAVLGTVGVATRGAVRLLEQAGMKFLEHIDPFDGGPYYGGIIAELNPVKQLRRLTARAGAPPLEQCTTWMVACEDRAGFRAVRTEAVVSEHTLTVSESVLAALTIADGATVCAIPLP